MYVVYRTGPLSPESANNVRSSRGCSGSFLYVLMYLSQPVDKPLLIRSGTDPGLKTYVTMMCVRTQVIGRLSIFSNYFTYI